MCFDEQLTIIRQTAPLLARGHVNLCIKLVCANDRFINHVEFQLMFVISHF